MNEKELIKKALNWMLMFFEMNQLHGKMSDDVRLMHYESAASYRDQARKIAEQMPTIEEIRELRNKLNS